MDTICIFLLSEPKYESKLPGKVFPLLKTIQKELYEHSYETEKRIKHSSPSIGQKNASFYFFYNPLNSYVSFKKNLFKANFLSNKFKVK